MVEIANAITVKTAINNSSGRIAFMSQNVARTITTAISEKPKLFIVLNRYDCNLCVVLVKIMPIIKIFIDV